MYPVRKPRWRELGLGERLEFGEGLELVDFLLHGEAALG